MATQKKNFLDSSAMRLILSLVCLVLAAVILALSALTIIDITHHSYEAAPKYLVWIFIASGLIKLVMFLRERTKLNLVKSLSMLVFNIVLGIVVLFAPNNPFLFSLTAGLYCLTIVLGAIFNIIKNHTVRSIIFNSLVITFAIAMCIGLFVSPIAEVEQLQNVILVECIFIAVVSFIEAASIALSQLKLKVLMRIVLNTFSLEILFGLLTMIVCFSLVFMRIEPNITTFPEALWYCFAIVPTIGFGDFVATTAIGRVLSVVLGLYGIVVVAVITSIVVNFYNETSGKLDKKELKAIQKEEEENQNK